MLLARLWGRASPCGDGLSGSAPRPLWVSAMRLQSRSQEEAATFRRFVIVRPDAMLAFLNTNPEGDGAALAPPERSVIVGSGRYADPPQHND